MKTVFRKNSCIKTTAASAILLLFFCCLAAACFLSYANGFCAGFERLFADSGKDRCAEMPYSALICPLEPCGGAARILSQDQIAPAAVAGQSGFSACADCRQARFAAPDTTNFSADERSAKAAEFLPERSVTDGARHAANGGAAVKILSVSERTLTVLKLVAVGVSGGAAAAALLLFMFVFPVINRLFGTNLPGLNFFYEHDDNDEGKVSGAKKTKAGKSTARSKNSGTRSEKTDRTAAAKRTKADKSRTRGKTKESRAEKVVYDDKAVPTVRIDTLYNPGKTAEISASKIDRAVRTAAIESDDEPDSFEIKKRKAEQKRQKRQAAQSGAKTAKGRR